MTTGCRVSDARRQAAAQYIVSKRRRRITPQAGHALEILGHAIGYLTDEFVHHRAESSSGKANLEAVQLLMALNRQIYFECPEVLTLGERFRSLVRFPSA
jgi:hypothetical protein